MSFNLSVVTHTQTHAHARTARGNDITTNERNHSYTHTETWSCLLHRIHLFCNAKQMNADKICGSSGGSDNNNSRSRNISNRKIKDARARVFVYVCMCECAVYAVRKDNWN